MSYDYEPQQIGDDAAIAAERRKVVVRWRSTFGNTVHDGVAVGKVHACIGAWVPMTYQWTTLHPYTFCGMDTKEDTAANRKTLWCANVAYIEAVDCEECRAGYAAWKLRESRDELQL